MMINFSNSKDMLLKIKHLWPKGKDSLIKNIMLLILIKDRPMGRKDKGKFIIKMALLNQAVKYLIIVNLVKVVLKEIAII